MIISDNYHFVHLYMQPWDLLAIIWKARSMVNSLPKEACRILVLNFSIVPNNYENLYISSIDLWRV